MTNSVSALDAYLTHLTVERRLAANSIESYARDLNGLAEFAAGRGQSVEQLTRQDLEALVRDLMSQGRSPRSVARAVACYRGFYRFLLIDGRLRANPSEDLRSAARVEGPAALFLSVEDVDRLIAQPDVSTPRGLRDRAVIELLYATGMRVSELVALRPADVHLEASYLTCTGKGDKQRIVPIGDEAAAWVKRYLQQSRIVLLGRRRSTRLFVNARGGGIGLTRVGLLEDPQGLRASGGHHDVTQPAHASTLVCDASARAGSRPARDSDDVGPRRSVDDADLHARARATDAHHLRPVSPARMRRRWLCSRRRRR